MNVSYAQSAAALTANARWQEVIAENLASSHVPGYKKQDFSFSAFEAGQLPVRPGLAKPFVLPQASSSISFQPGELKPTGVPTDLALEGPGFLSVQLPDGSVAYTRDGEFRVSSTGQLVTKQGYEVMGTGGPVLLDLNNPGEISISATGQVSQGTDLQGRLLAVEFANPELLRPISQGLFLADHPDLVQQDAERTKFRQGFVEGANTSASAEMVQLIAAMRIYEANQRALQTHDDRIGRAIRELAAG